jgi:hypothetical protein
MKIAKKIFPIVVGAGLGYAYYHFIGCNNGCPIQSNPYMSMGYGALMGSAFALPFKKKPKENSENENESK